MIYNETLNDYEKICGSCTIYLVLFFIAFLIIIGISSTYFYFHWYLKKDIMKHKFIKHKNGNYLLNIKMESIKEINIKS